MICPVDASQPDPEVIAQAAQHLQAGRLIVIPTETVYGLACDPRVAGAEDAVYRAKDRPPGKAIARFVADPADFFDPHHPPNPLVLALAEKFMPGPLTLVLPFQEDWVGFRIPDHPVALALVEQMGSPLAVPSANRSGQPDPKTAQEASADLGDSVAMVLDAGPSPMGRPSTVIRVDEDRIEILREGALPIQDIEEAARPHHGHVIHE